MTSKRQNRHPDVMHESQLTPPCKTTFPSPDRLHGNSGRVCKKQNSQPMQFPGYADVFPLLLSTQGMGAPFNFNQQAQAQMNFRPD